MSDDLRVPVAAIIAVVCTAVVSIAAMWAQNQYHVSPWLCPGIPDSGAVVLSLAAIGLAMRSVSRAA